MAENISTIPCTETESELILGNEDNNIKLDSNSEQVLLNNYDSVEISATAEVQHSLNDVCLPSIKSHHVLNDSSPEKQSENQFSNAHFSDTSSIIPNKNLQNEDYTAVSCDSDSCTTSSNESIIETNIDNLSINSSSSQDSSKPDCNSESTKIMYGISSVELIKTLEDRNLGLANEITELKRTLQTQELSFKKAESQIRTEFLSNIEKLSKECNSLRKDKEAMVIRYANSEKEVIVGKKAYQELDKKLRDISKERDNLLTKIKHLSSENNRLTILNEKKMTEISNLQKNFEKLNSDFNAREIRIKWLQNNLKTEMNSHQETQTKLDHTVHRLNEMREEAEQLRKDCQEMIKCYQEAEEIKSVKLDSQLKQKLSELEVQKQEHSDQEQVYQLLRQELEALKKKQRSTMEENSSLTLKIHNLEKQRLEYEQNISKLKDNQNSLQQEIVDLTARLAEMETLQLQLQREKEKSAANVREIERLRSTNSELQADMNACHIKEGELLKFTEGVTDTNVKLQSAYSLLEVKAQALQDELTETKTQLSDLQEKYLHSVSELEQLRKEHEDEGQSLARKLAEKIKNVEQLNMQLDEAENENRVLKRRHIASIKELSRELYECKRRLDAYESSNGIRTDSCSLGSRTSSVGSLDVLNSNESKICPTFTSSPSKCMSVKVPTNEKFDTDMPGIDKEMLIEKIIKLQNQLMSKNERIDFLKDHIVHLVREMKRKCKCNDLKPIS